MKIFFNDIYSEYFSNFILDDLFFDFSVDLDINFFLPIELNDLVLEYKNLSIELYDDFLIAKADLENFKKRSNEDISKTYKYAIEDFSESLLGVLDSLESAYNDKNKSSDSKKLIEGVGLTLKLFNNILNKNHIFSIFPEKDDIFDPYKHLAISTVNIPEKNNNIIFAVLQKGYIIFDKVLRPALVVVNKVN